MIITGFPGIGKSTIARKYDKVIDLESSSFWKYEEDIYRNRTGEKSRHDDWYVYYCQVAIDLSEQGYVVFVACHPDVRKYLSIHHNNERFCAIFPLLNLKDVWIEKLYQRYLKSNSDKDNRAYNHIKKAYEADVAQLLLESEYNEEYYHDVEMINNIDYDLETCVLKLISRSKEK